MTLIITLLGMHRSGTSFLTGALQNAGAYLGGGLADGPAADNLEGHFEACEAVRINDRILYLSGGSWNRVPAELRGDEEVDSRIKVFLEALSSHPVAGWKDPRTTLTFPLWKPHLRDYQIVACFRHPLCVAKSLQARDGFSLDQSLRLWMEYNECLLRIADAERHDVFWFDFDMSPKELRHAVTILVGRLGLAAANINFNPYLRHQALETAPLEPCIQRLYESLRERAHRQSALWGLTSSQEGSSTTETEADYREAVAQLIRVQGRFNELLQQIQRSLQSLEQTQAGMVVPAVDDIKIRLSKVERRVFVNALVRCWRKFGSWTRMARQPRMEGAATPWPTRSR